MILSGLLPTSGRSRTRLFQEHCIILSWYCWSCQSNCVLVLYFIHRGMSFFLLFHSLWCRKEKYEKVSECLQIIILESKYDRNPSFIVRSRNKYDRNASFLWCHDFSSWCLLSVLRLIYFSTLIDTTFLRVYRYRRYDRSCLFKPTLRSVFSASTDVTMGVIDFNRRSVLLTCGPVTDVTIGILGSWPAFTF